MDKNGDGFISWSEALAYFKKREESNPQFNKAKTGGRFITNSSDTAERKVKNFFKRNDSDADKKVTFEEFCEAHGESMRYAQTEAEEEDTDMDAQLINSRFMQTDQDKNGKITHDEWIADGNDPDDFEKWDDDHSGDISREEYRKHEAARLKARDEQAGTIPWGSNEGE